MKYQVYIDSGTTNTRLYLLDSEQNCVAVKKCSGGSKDSAKAHDKDFHVKLLYGLYEETLRQQGISDSDVESIYMSGMVTNKYGVHEVPHCGLPVTADEFADHLVSFYEDKRFRRELILVPGIRQSSESFALTGLARGEEIELFGMTDMLQREYGKQTIAVAMPGSHTHVAFVRGDKIVGLCSNITGEIFYAIKESTVLAPVLSEAGTLDPEWIVKGVAALNQYGLTRALYLPHTMNMLDQYQMIERKSFTEGVLFGGIAQSTEYFVQKLFPECNTLLIAADGEVGELYRAVFSTCERFSTVKILPTPQEPWALQGYRKLRLCKN